MYNILLTDDEKIVIDSLTFILEKDFPTQVSIFTAQSGLEAVNAFRSEKIDIAFIDINMPGLNGLDAIREIKQASPFAILIVLSAFDRFQYAQEALNLGVYKYLTKPVNRNLIVQTIRNAMLLVDSARGKLTTDLQMKEKLNFVSPIVESDFIYASIFASDDQRDISSYFKFLNITKPSFFYCCIELPNLNEQSRCDMYVLLRSTVLSSVEAIIGPVMGSRVIMYIPAVSSGDSARDNEDIRQRMSSLFKQLAVNVISGIRMGVSAICTDTSAMQSAYKEALDSLNTCPASGGLAFAGKAATNGKGSIAPIISCEQQLLSRIQAGDAAALNPIAALYFSSLWKFFENSLDAAKDRLFTLLVKAASVAESCASSALPDSCTFAVLRNTDTKNELEQYVLSRLSLYASCVSETLSTKINPIIIRARAYIAEHMMNEISLDETASAIHVNPYYLSKLFKEETGANFIDYLTDLRLEKARELLREGKLSIKEISHTTGYSDQNYFSKLFRRKFGITPTEFRNSVRSDAEE